MRLEEEQMLCVLSVSFGGPQSAVIFYTRSQA